MIYLNTIFPKTVANVWSGCQTCTSYFSNYLSLLDTLPLANQNFRHVKVLGSICFIVLYFYKVSVTRCITCLNNHTGCGCHNRRAVWCGIIGSVMCFETLLYRMKPVV